MEEGDNGEQVRESEVGRSMDDSESGRGSRRDTCNGMGTAD